MEIDGRHPLQLVRGGAGYIYKVTDTTSDGDDFFALNGLKTSIVLIGSRPK